MMAKFPFNDLHSFKDYVGFVKLCAPDMFPKREGLKPEEQWTLDLAFEGLQSGMQLAMSEKGNLPIFENCRTLIDEAKHAYFQHNIKGGYSKLDEVAANLKKIPTR